MNSVENDMRTETKEGQKAKDYAPFLRLYEDRINELRAISREEAFGVDETSVRRFVDCLRDAPFEVRRAGLALGEQGELNAVWVSDDRQTRFSIEIRPNGDFEYAWLPSDRTVEVQTIDSSEFWSHIRPEIKRFLLNEG